MHRVIQTPSKRPLTRPVRPALTWLVRVALALLSVSLHQASGATTTPDTPRITPIDSPLSYRSGTQQVQLIELFTSEGCSSCPPADAYLSDYRQSPELWQSVVPIAYHVSYWDRLGWPDRFAQRAFDRRQREVARLADSGVYTPGVFRRGKEWRGWRRGEPAARPLPTGELQLIAEAEAWSLDYQPRGKRHAVNAYLAYLGNDLHTRVPRGENAGRRLQHDFVVLDLHKVAVTADQEAQFSVPFDPQVGATTFVARPDAIAAWVEDSTGEVLQAVGGVLPRQP